MPFHHFIRDASGWRTHHAAVLFANPHLEVHLVTVASPMRPDPFTWTVTHRKGAVVVAARTVEGKFVLVRQERVPIRATIWEFPAGQIDDHEESEAIRATGLRELAEEAGYELVRGGEVVSLGHFFPSAGFTDEHSHLLLISPVTIREAGAAPDPHEGIAECKAFTEGELRQMIATGEVRDANTLAAFARLVARGLI